MQDDRPASQTLDRGLRVLEHVVRANVPLAVADVARGVDIHRSVAYRMMRTLEDHGLLARDEQGRYVPGAGLAALSGRFRPQLRAAAARHLHQLVLETGMTSFLVVRNGGEAVTIDVVEPPAGDGRHQLPAGREPPGPPRSPRPGAAERRTAPAPDERAGGDRRLAAGAGQPARAR